MVGAFGYEDENGDLGGESLAYTVEQGVVGCSDMCIRAEEELTDRSFTWPQIPLDLPLPLLWG